MRLLVLAALTLSSLTGCATGGANRPARVVDPRALVTAGSRCSGSACICREVDAVGATVGIAPSEAADPSGEGLPAPGTKRFELRTGRGTDEVSVTLEDRGTLHKPSEPIGAACGYVDLAPGRHRVHVSVKSGPSEGGASPKFLVYEYGARTQSWYTTFGMSCGETGPCTDGDLHERMAHLARLRGLFDACGSTKVRDLRWENHKGADERVTSMDLDFTLDVFRFEPRFPRGGACKGPTPE